MRLACETVVNEILPAVRSLIAKELHQKGYTQTEIADLLDITQPAVSQYLSAARGKKVQRIEDDEVAYEQVRQLVDELATGAADDDLSETFCQICADIRERNVFSAVDADDGVCMTQDLDIRP